MQASALDTLCINTLRTLSIDAVWKARSGHPGLPLGAAPMAYVLWKRHLKFAPNHPHWPGRDRFVLSAGHGSMLLYSLLHLSGYDLPMKELQAFRSWGSKTPGHPEFHLTPGVEATTGPLGQGAANAVGMAIAERFAAKTFNRPGFDIVNHFTYALVSDGDVMEGVTAEAASLAGHLKLGRLIYLYDANDVTLDGPTSMTFSTEDVAVRFAAYGWQVLTVPRGDTDLEAIDQAITEAKRETKRPSLIIVKTTIGFASPKAGTSSVHGSPLNAEEITATKAKLGWTSTEPFFVPDAAREHFSQAGRAGEYQAIAWEERFVEYSKCYPELSLQWKLALSCGLPEKWNKDVPQFSSGTQLATREAFGQVLNAFSKKVPWIIGGDADLGCSTNTVLKGEGSFEGQEGSGRNIHFGVREHAMGSIANGMAYHGLNRPFVATFFCFSDYMRPAVRLAALNKLPVLFVWTHDSIGLGEDGPTHQPVEHLASLRAMLGLVTLRPCDAAETAEALQIGLERTTGPTAIVLSRQKLPVLDRSKLASAQGARCGAYVLSESSIKPIQAILIATGSEVSLALQTQALLEKEGLGVRVVSMPSWELFSQESRAYKDRVLPPELRTRISIEAGVSFGWERWVGERGVMVSVERFGHSAPEKVIWEQFGFTPEAIAKRVRTVTGLYPL